MLAQLTRDGTKDAAAIVTDLTRSFPSARHVVMSGVAGGVPAPDSTDRHVRLGDIVSSAEGVVDYRHVWALPTGDVLRRATVGISAALLRADRALEGQQRTGSSPWLTLIDGSTRPVPAGFRRPAEATDILIMGDDRVPHPGGSRRGIPAVHRGIIGSADQLVRNVQRRDEMARLYGIRAVEMEGSGVAVGADLHGVHWYVVRGVVDYCDDRKNDIWHPYSALAAAAYARALLAEVPPVVAGAQRATEGLGAIVEALLTLPEMKDDYRRRMVLAALPDRVRTQVADNPVPRLHVLAIVQTCERFTDGRDLLLAALRLAAGDACDDLADVVEVLRSRWPRRA